MWRIDPKKGPVYKQLADQVAIKVAKGELNPGDKLPSARDLAKEALVNPNTVVSAFAELEERQLIEKRRGLGSFIRQDADVDHLKMDLLIRYSNDFIQKVEGLGISVSEAILQLKNMRNL